MKRNEKRNKVRMSQRLRCIIPYSYYPPLCYCCVVVFLLGHVRASLRLNAGNHVVALGAVSEERWAKVQPPPPSLAFPDIFWVRVLTKCSLRTVLLTGGEFFIIIIIIYLFIYLSSESLSFFFLFFLFFPFFVKITLYSTRT